MTVDPRPVCKCGVTCARAASENGHSRYFCCNTACPNWGKPVSFTAPIQVGSRLPTERSTT